MNISNMTLTFDHVTWNSIGDLYSLGASTALSSKVVKWYYPDMAWSTDQPTSAKWQEKNRTDWQTHWLTDGRIKIIKTSPTRCVGYNKIQELSVSPLSHAVFSEHFISRLATSPSLCIECFALRLAPEL